MKNPWELSRERFFHVHPDDAWQVRQHNSNAKPNVTIQQSLPALPYLGDPRTARVILLGKNPSFTPQDEIEATDNPALIEENFKALCWEGGHPFFPFSPAFEGTTSSQWWHPVLDELIAAVCEKTGEDTETVLSRIAVLQWHPYRSQSAFDPKVPFPTQSYNFHLADLAAARGALFVFQYGSKTAELWRGAVKAISADSIRLKSAQTPHLSSRNMAEADFARLVEVLSA